MVVVIFQTAVLVQQSTSKLINTTFYLEIFTESNAYGFLVTDLPNSVLEDIRRESENPILEQSGLSNEFLSSSIEKIMPPEWIQRNFETNVEEVSQYIIGVNDGFDISIPLNERAEAAENQINFIITNTDLRNIILENQVRPFATEASETKLPFNVSISEDELMEFIKRILSEEWAAKQTNSVLSELTPYAVGRNDDYTAVITIDDRIDAVIFEIKSTLSAGNAYEALFKESIAPGISSTIGNVAKLPHGVDVTNEEISSIIKKATPHDWIQEVTESILDSATPYLAGTTDEFSVSIDITPNKEKAVNGLMDLAEQKLNDKLENLPYCDADTLAYMLGRPAIDFPSCFPATTELREEMQDYSQALIIDVLSAVRPQIITKIPNSVEFSQNSLRKSMPIETWNSFDQGRSILKEGYTFTQSDLEKLVKQNGNIKPWDQFIFIRNSISQGIHYTDEDFLTHMEKIAGGREQTLFRIEQIREIFKTINNLDVLLYLLSVLLAMLVGYLVGIGWTQKLKWAATAMLIASLLVYLSWGPIYSTLMEPVVQEKVEQISASLVDQMGPQFVSTKYLLSQQLINMGEIAISKFVSGIAQIALITSISSTVFIVACMEASKINIRTRKR